VGLKKIAQNPGKPSDDLHAMEVLMIGQVGQLADMAKRGD
jgi:hypothetical protein